MDRLSLIVYLIIDGTSKKQILTASQSTLLEMGDWVLPILSFYYYMTGNLLVKFCLNETV